MPGEQTQSSNGQHVAVLAFPFGSHALTISSLMIKLASAAPNLEFSFFSTKKSNDSLFPASRNNLPDNVRVYDIEDGLPEVKHASAVNNPLMFVELFLKAAPENFRRGLELAAEETGRKISCLITDIFLTFSEEIAGNMNVPWIPLSVAMPYDISAHIYTDLIRQLRIKCDNTNTTQLEEQTLDVIPGLSMMRVSDVPDEILLSDSLFASTLSKFGVVLPKATAIVVNFFLELYSSSQLENDLKSKLPTVLNVGFLTQPMPPPPLPPSHSDETGCLRWLDGKKAKSVAYISFGTVATPPPDELMAIAEALEESGIHFLWSLRDDKLCLLPENFLERTTTCGKIVPRAPQTQVLGHSSTGVFVTHSGANSVCESIANEVPMISRPFFGDHRMNARMVEEVWGIGVKVEGMKFTKSGVLKSMELIFSEKGKKMRENLQALKETAIEAAGPNGSANQDFNTLLEKISNVKEPPITFTHSV